MSSARRGGGGGGRGRGRGGFVRSANASEDEGSVRHDNRGVQLDAAAPIGTRGRGLVRGVGKAFQKATGPQQQRPQTRPAPAAPSTSPNVRPNGSLKANGFPARANGAAGGDAGASYEQRYQMLKRRREQERVDAIAQGFLADPNRPRRLSEAITPVGTCQDMCPEFERVERVVQRDVWGPEADPDRSNNGSFRLPIEERMVKKFRRSAAGLDEQLPSDLRPPLVLQETVDYLFNEVITNAESLGDVHHFVWDRTRAIRNDFSIQQVGKVPELRIAIDCYERIARFHILSLHQLATPEKPYDKYDWQQDREQLDRTMLSLMQYYDDSRERYRSANEAEFRAYCIIFQIQSRIPDMEDKVQSWPQDVVRDPRVQRALKLYAAAGNITDLQGPGSFKPPTTFKVAQQNWQRFWKLVASNEISYLASCACEIYFNLVRRIALTSVWVAYRQGGDRRPEDWTITELVDVLGFDTEEEVVQYCESYGFAVKTRADGTAYLDIASVPGRRFPQPVSKPPDQMLSRRIVETKRHGRTFAAVINGLSVKAAKQAGLIEEQLVFEREVKQKTQESSLFVTGHSDDEEEAPVNGNASSSPAPKLNPFASPFTPLDAASDARTSWGPSPSNYGGFGKPSGPPVNGEHAAKPSLFSFDSTASANSKPSSPFTPFAPPAQNGKEAINTASPFPSASSSTARTSFGAPSSTAPTSSFGKPSGVSTSPAALTSLTAGTNDAPIASTTMQPIFSFGTPSKSVATPAPGTPPVAKPLFSFSAPSNTATSDVNTTPASPRPSPFATPSTSTHPFTFGAQSSVPPTTASQPQQSQFPSILGNNPLAGTQQPAVPFSFLTAPLTTSAVTSASSAPKPEDRQELGESGRIGIIPDIQVTPPSKPALQQSALPQFNAPRFDFSSKPMASAASPSIQRPTSGQPVDSPAPFEVMSSVDITEPRPSASPQTSAQTSHTTSNQPSSYAQSNIESNPSVLASSRQAQQELRKSRILDSLAKDVVLEPSKGLLKQYIEYTTGSLIFECMQQVEAETAQQQADDFRRRVLSVRYGRLWIANATRLRLKRQGRERRRRLAAERVARASEEPSIEEKLDAFRASQNEKREVAEVENGSSNSARQETAVDTNGTAQKQVSACMGQSGLHASTLIDHIPRLSVRERHRRRKQASVATATPQKSPYRVTKRAASPAPSTLSAHSSLLGCSFLSGASLLGAAAPGARMSTTRTNYFHLKALGIQPEDSWRNDRLVKKRSREDDEDESVAGSPETRRFASPPGRQSTLLERARALVGETPTRSPPRTQHDKIRAEIEARDEALFTRIRAVRKKHLREEQDGSEVGSPDSRRLANSLDRQTPLTKTAPTGASKAKTRTQAEAEDEALFARLRAASKAMDESISFYREEIAKEDQLRRSQSSAASDTPPKVQQSPPDNRPKYWGRVSQFVPREEYGRAKSQQKGKEVLRRGEVDGVGQIDGVHGGRSTSAAGPRSLDTAPKGPHRNAGMSFGAGKKKDTPQQARAGTSAEDAIEL